MATASTLIPIEEYLRTSYHPDCDFVDGEIQERNLGEREHGLLQAALTAWFFNNAKTWNIYAIVEQRIRVTARRVRIAGEGVLEQEEAVLVVLGGLFV